MKIIRPLEQVKFSEIKSPSIFLAGPSPRHGQEDCWRPEALKILEDFNYFETVIIPVPEDTSKWSENYEDQIEWEKYYLDNCDIILFWIPRDLKDFPGFTTNVEFGMYLNSGKIVLGYPPNTPNIKYLDWHATLNRVPIARERLKDTIFLAIDLHIEIQDEKQEQRKLDFLPGKL